MTVYTAIPQDDSNLDVQVTEAPDLVEINIQPAAFTGVSSGDVNSVNGQTGVVVLDTDDIDEGDTNLYYTQGRFDTAFGNKTTTDLTEGTNLYYTDARVDDFLRSGDVDVINFTDGAATLDWNVDDGTLNLNYANDVSLQLGQETHFYAKATEAISNGDIVMFAGAQGSHLLIALADQSAPGFQPEYVIGIATQDFNNNEFGYVTSFGKVRDLDTSAYTEGDIIWLDPATPGGWTTTRPTPAQGHSIQVAAVTYSQNNNGTIFVKLTHMPDTDETPEGSTNLYYTDARVQAVIDTNTAGFATETYVDTAKADAISAANSYTLNQIGMLDIPTATSDLTNDSGFITGYTETDPVFQASVAADITQTDIDNWNNPPAGYTDADVDAHLNTTGATTDQVLSWTGSDYAWVDQSGGGGGASSLDDLTDVEINTGLLGDGDILRYNGTAEVWQNTNLSISTTPVLDGFTESFAGQVIIVTITNYNDYDDPNIWAQVKNSSGTVVVSNSDITDNYDGTFSFTGPADPGTDYVLEVRVQDFGDIASEIASNTFDIIQLFGWTTRYIRIANFTTENDINDLMYSNFRFYTGTAQTGTALPSNMTSDTEPAPFMITTSSGDGGYTNYEVWRAFDANLNSAWWTLGASSAIANAWVTIDLGAEYTINSMELRTGNNYSDIPNGFTLYTSDTGAFAGEEVQRETLTHTDGINAIVKFN